MGCFHAAMLLPPLRSPARTVLQLCQQPDLSTQNQATRHSAWKKVVVLQCINPCACRARASCAA